jgi:hypothetical protein
LTVFSIVYNPRLKTIIHPLLLYQELSLIFHIDWHNPRVDANFFLQFFNKKERIMKSKKPTKKSSSQRAKVEAVNEPVQQAQQAEQTASETTTQQDVAEQPPHPQVSPQAQLIDIITRAHSCLVIYKETADSLPTYGGLNLEITAAIGYAEFAKASLTKRLVG